MSSIPRLGAGIIIKRNPVSKFDQKMSTMDRSCVKFGSNALFIIAIFFMIAYGSSFWVGGDHSINFLSE